MTVLAMEKDTTGVDLSGLEKFGKFHYLQYLLICLPVFMTSMLHVNYIFISEKTDYRCTVPECENSNSTIKTPHWWPTDVDRKCVRPVLDNEQRLQIDGTDLTCSNVSFLINEVTQCDDWIYANNNTIVSAFNLGCESWQASLTGTVHNAGMMASMYIAGWLCDSFGRKPAVIICAIGGFVGLFKIFVTNIYAYLVIEFLESAISSGLYIVGLILMIEIGGDARRVSAGVVFAYAIYMGEVVYASISMGLKYWKYIIMVLYSPLILYVTYILVLKESPRWHMIRGKTEEVKATFKSMARMNKIKLTDDEIDSLSSEQIREKFNVVLQEQKESYKEIFGSREIVKRIIVTSICFFTSSFLYYGVIVNSIYLPGDKYINMIMSSLMAFPGDIIAFISLNKFGRRITLQCGYAVCATFLIAQVYAPATMPWLKIVLFLVGKFAVVICFTAVYTYAMELFPTSVRGSLFGWGTTVARIGGMLAPLTPLLLATLEALPSILFAATALTSAVAVAFTPETKFLPLFDTIAQVEEHKTNEKTKK